MSVENILSILKTIKTGVVSLESEVVFLIEEKFKEFGIKYSKEVFLSKGCRVDFLTEDGIAIEVKKGKPNTRSVSMQIQRYASSDKVTAVILVSERGLFSHITEANGKSVGYVSLSSNWGIAL
jgi:hypothetical protein